VVFWYEFVTNEGNKHDIHGQILKIDNNSIQKVGSEFLGNVNDVGRQSDPAVIALNDNKFLVAFESMNLDFTDKKVVLQ